MFRLEYFELVRVRQEEMLRDAERARLAARVNRRERQANGRRIGLRLQAFRPLNALRQAF